MLFTIEKRTKRNKKCTYYCVMSLTQITFLQQIRIIYSLPSNYFKGLTWNLSASRLRPEDKASNIFLKSSINSWGRPAISENCSAILKATLEVRPERFYEEILK